MAETRSQDARTDLLTVLAIGTVAYLIKNVVHEGLGHGLRVANRRGFNEA